MVDQGKRTVAETNRDFQQLAEGVGKTGTLIREISQASEEQSAGVTSINRAVSNLTNLIQTSRADG
jgi:methyl-accepting chemotaxis protein